MPQSNWTTPEHPSLYQCPNKQIKTNNKKKEAVTDS